MKLLIPFIMVLELSCNPIKEIQCDPSRLIDILNRDQLNKTSNLADLPDNLIRYLDKNRDYDLIFTTSEIYDQTDIYGGNVPNAKITEMAYNKEVRCGYIIYRMGGYYKTNTLLMYINTNKNEYCIKLFGLPDTVDTYENVKPTLNDLLQIYYKD